MKSLDELIAKGKRLYFEDSLTLKEAAQKLMSESIDDEVADELRYRGIHVVLTRAIRDGRYPYRQSSEDRAKTINYQPRGLEGQTARFSFLYPRLTKVWYEGVDGKPKPLISFTFDDCKHRADVERSVIQGATGRVELMAAMAEALQAEGKSKASQLRKATLENLEGLARKVYGSAEGSSEIDETVGRAVVSGEAQ